MNLNYYISEFVAIADYLIKSKTHYKKTLTFIVTPKKQIEELLDKNKFDTSKNKLKLWKSLNWIDAEEERLTKRIYDKDNETYIPCIKIYIKVYETLKEYSKK